MTLIKIIIGLTYPKGSGSQCNKEVRRLTRFTDDGYSAVHTTPPWIGLLNQQVRSVKAGTPSWTACVLLPAPSGGQLPMGGVKEVASFSLLRP